MCDKMAISAYTLTIVEKDSFLRLQMRAKEMLTSIILLTFPSSLLDGLKSRHFGFDRKFSLWCFIVMKACVVARRSICSHQILVFQKCPGGGDSLNFMTGVIMYIFGI